MNKIPKSLFLIVLVLTIFGTSNGFGQTKRKKPKSLRESARKSRHERDSVFQAISKNDTSVNSLLQRVEQYTTTFNQINNSLAEGLDTDEVSQQLPLIEKRTNKIQTLANTKKSSTLRYLFVLRDNLDHMQDQIQDWQSDLDDVNTKLIQNQHDILQFTKDSLLKIVPTDSALKSAFITQRSAVKALWRKTDSVNRSNLFKVNLLQNKVTMAYSSILDENDQIDSKIKKFAIRAESGEFGYLWQINPQYNNFAAAFGSTLQLHRILATFFINNENITHLGMFLFLVVIAGWVTLNWYKARARSDNPEIMHDQINYIYTRPVASTLLIVTAIAPYFYDHPPTIFLETFFLISIMCALVIVKNNIPKSAYNFLIQLFCLAFVYSLSNLFIQITNADRYLIALLSIAAVAIAASFYKKIKQEPNGHLPFTRQVLVIFIALQIVSFLLNVSGRFSLAKIIGITTVFNSWMLVILYIIIHILIQGIYLQFHTKRKQENTFISWIDYTVLQKKFRSTLMGFAALLWVFFLVQNLNIDDWLHDYLTDILNQSRTIGGASFTFGGFVIFIIVIWLSTLVSKIISYFFDISAQHASDLSALKKKNRASTLLIRIGVFTVGFLLAVAASGFPIDKLTIIFSAFGVGIGFGLQNIVNNLVSGMILAFEKPIQIGDIIEVDNHMGTIKEIGIRSSKIATGNGSEVIIPNGDLISHQVVNWTLSDTNSRVELAISVAYTDDIEKAKKVLVDLFSNRDDILGSPGPSVFVNNITDKQIEFKASFWASDISKSSELRSRILTDIYAALNREGIKLPSS
jgi:potassium-dependent mechanosensitive channel